jgi:polysaccharide export outer membrane protein
MLWRCALWIVAILGLAGAAAAQSRTDEYRIAVGDRLSISVLEDPGLNQSVLVRPDGRISLPLAGTLDAADRTPEELQSAIRRALGRDFIEPPTVTVSVVGLGEPDGELAILYVLGQVGRPGALEVELPIDVLQALALAGGPSVFAATERIQVRRRERGAERVMIFNYALVDEGLTPTDAFDLADGDVIVVPERGLFE